MTNRDALIILNAIPGVGNRTIAKLIQHFGSAVAVLDANDEQLTQTGLKPALVRNIFHFSRDIFLENEYNLIQQHQVKIVTLFDKNYPAVLKHIPDAPSVLYIKGQWPLDLSKALAVVGSRRCSLYGRTTTEELAFQLAEQGVVVVSGLARGIDTSAHRGCLKAEGTTVAVLGCGLTHMYPAQNKELSEAIVDQGCLISEFPMETKPAPYNFPRRNRIISGLSQGVVVVEAARKSGALITCDFAAEQGKDVFAVPGKIDHESSEGTLDLIKDGAIMVTSVEDILGELPHLAQETKEVEAPIEEEQFRQTKISDEEQSTLEHIGRDPVDVEELTRRSGFPTSAMMSHLMNLELKKLIKQIPGKRFVRK